MRVEKTVFYPSGWKTMKEGEIWRWRDAGQANHPLGVYATITIKYPYKGNQNHGCGCMFKGECLQAFYFGKIIMVFFAACFVGNTRFLARFGAQQVE